MKMLHRYLQRRQRQGEVEGRERKGGRERARREGGGKTKIGRAEGEGNKAERGRWVNKKQEREGKEKTVNQREMVKVEEGEPYKKT